MKKNLRTVDKWNKTLVNDGLVDLPALQLAFERGTGEYVAPDYHYFFSEIYVPILVRNEDHSPKLLADGSNFEFQYVNVGLSAGDLTDAYWMLYRSNMLSEPLTNANAYEDAKALGKLIKCVLNLNKYKYLKWIDSMGYAYNPLWNVDGTDFFQYIDTHGNVVRKDAPILQYAEKLKTNSYSGALQDTNETQNTYAGTFMNGQVETFGKSDYDNTQDIYSVSKEEHDHVTDDSIGGTLKAITGGDYSHIEKRIRSGNIGVTQTSELIRNERELVRFNLIQEFFNDVNKQLLVGVFPGF